MSLTLLVLLCALAHPAFSQKCRMLDLQRESPFPTLSIVILRDYEGNVVMESDVALHKLPEDKSAATTTTLMEFRPPKNDTAVVSLEIKKRGDQMKEDMVGLWCQGMEEGVILEAPFDTPTSELYTPRNLKLELGSTWVRVTETTYGSPTKVVGEANCTLSTFPHLELKARCGGEEGEECPIISQFCAKGNPESPSMTQQGPPPMTPAAADTLSLYLGPWVITAGLMIIISGYATMG